MSENPLPTNVDLRQLRTQAKERLRELQQVDPTAKLADAQHQLARKYGFENWPKLIAEVETPILIEQFKTALRQGDADTVETLLRTKNAVASAVNEPIFDFGATAYIQAGQHPQAAKLLPVLVKFGADPNARSNWWAGSFGPLDYAKPETVDLLLGLGTNWDVWSAAAHGRVDVLQKLLQEEPSRVNAPGGDGMTPLHFATTVEVVELLVSHGADLERKDVDHESTPAQHHINRPEILQALLSHGAKPDIYIAAVLNDVDIAEQILGADPRAIASHVGLPPFSTEKSNGGHIYTYLLGGGKTPSMVAAERGSRQVASVFESRVSPIEGLVVAAWMGDAEKVSQLKGTEIPVQAAGALARAAGEGRTETVRLLLIAGFDPLYPGMDSGSALHVACWFGQLDVVKLLTDQVPLELRDQNHGSTPLGWACHGAQWCRNPKGDYPAVVEALLKAGADVRAPANKDGVTMRKQAGTRDDVIAVLRRFGA